MATYQGCEKVSTTWLHTREVKRCPLYGYIPGRRPGGKTLLRAIIAQREEEERWGREGGGEGGAGKGGEGKGEGRGGGEEEETP